MKRSRNEEIKIAAKNAGVYLWEVAEQLGIGNSAFSVKLRYELSPEEKEKILGIIDDISRRNTTMTHTPSQNTPPAEMHTFTEYTPAEMHTFAEYALEHVYKLNTHTPKTMQFDARYSPISVGVSLYFLSEDGWNTLGAEHADIYRHSSKNDVYDAIQRWEERYLKETPEDDTLG